MINVGWMKVPSQVSPNISSDELAKRSFYLSLSDQYWCAPTEHNLDWNDINFFTNNFSDDIGALLLDRKPNRISSDRYHSPNNTSEIGLRTEAEWAKALALQKQKQETFKNCSTKFSRTDKKVRLSSLFFLFAS